MAHCRHFIDNFLFKHYRDMVWPKFDKIILPLRLLKTTVNKNVIDLVSMLGDDYALGLCLYSEYGREQFWFTGHSKDDVLTLFHNESQLLLEFIDYFKQHTAHVLAELKQLHYTVYDHPLQLLVSSLQNHEGDQPFVCKDQYKNISFLHQIGVFSYLSETAKLTKKERDVLLMVSNGLSAKEIALGQHISTKTVEFHIDRIKRKLNAKNKVELISIYKILKHIGSEYLLSKMSE